MIYSGIYFVENIGHVNVQVDNSGSNPVHITLAKPDGDYTSFHIDIRLCITNDGYIERLPDMEYPTEEEHLIVDTINEIIKNKF